MNKLIYHKKPNLIDITAFVITVIIVSFVLLDRLEKYFNTAIIAVIVFDTLLMYLYTLRAFRQIFFFDDGIIIKSPLRRKDIRISYDDIKDIKYKYVPSSGTKLFVYYMDINEKLKRIGFEYFTKEGVLINFLKMKGLKVAEYLLRVADRNSKIQFH
jgi:hypothetical protein